MTFLRRCYHQILRPRRYLPKFANGLCYQSDAWVHLDPHRRGRYLVAGQDCARWATPDSPTGTTFFTPFMPCTLSASKLFNLPPKTGQSLIAALSIPGNLTSMP
jgi:hypothetical protein